MHKTGDAPLSTAVIVGMFRGWLIVQRGESGRGWTKCLISLGLPAASIAVFADPAGMMYGPDGILQFGRRVGFSIAAAAHHGKPGDFTGQFDTLTSSLITHVIREPLEVWNFGHVLDRVGSCQPLLSAAYKAGTPTGPIEAMKRCGDTQAVLYAQQLDGSNMSTGLIFIGSAFLLAAFMAISGFAVLKVSIKAIWTCAKLLPALWSAGFSDNAEQAAKDTVWTFIKHGIEVTVYIAFVGVMAMTVESLVTHPLPAGLGTDSPTAHVWMLGLAAVIAWALLREIKGELHGHPRILGRTARRAGELAVDAALTKGIGTAATAALAKTRKARRAAEWNRATGGASPLENIDGGSNASDVHGQPQTIDPMHDAEPEQPVAANTMTDTAPAEADTAGPSTSAPHNVGGVDPKPGSSVAHHQAWTCRDYPNEPAARAAAKAVGDGAYPYRSKLGVWHVGRNRATRTATQSRKAH